MGALTNSATTAPIFGRHSLLCIKKHSLFSPLESVSNSIFILFCETYGDVSLGAILARLHNGVSAAPYDTANIKYLSTSTGSLHDVVMCDLCQKRTRWDLSDKSFHMHACSIYTDGCPVYLISIPGIRRP